MQAVHDVARGQVARVCGPRHPLHRECVRTAGQFSMSASRSSLELSPSCKTPRHAYLLFGLLRRKAVGLLAPLELATAR